MPPLTSSRPVVELDECARALNLTHAHVANLELAFAENPRPNATVRDTISDQLHIAPRVVQLWFTDRRRRMKDEKEYEASRVEMILAQASASGPSEQSKYQPVIFQQQQQYQQQPQQPQFQHQQHQHQHQHQQQQQQPAEFQFDHDRPSTPSPSTSAESPGQLQTSSMASAYPPVTPIKTPDKHHTPIRRHSKSVSQVGPVTPARLVTADSGLSPQYVSPADSSYASVDRSMAAASAAGLYGLSPYQQPPSSAGYFFQPQHSPVYVTSQPGTPYTVSKIGNSPASQFSSQQMMSPIPLQRTYSTPLLVELDLQYQHQQVQRQFQQHQAAQAGGNMFSPLASQVSGSESKLAARRRRPLPSVRLHRSQSYSSAPQSNPLPLTSAPPYVANFAPSIMSGASPARQQLIAPPPMMMSLDSHSGDMPGSMRRSKSVSFVTSQPPSRSRKSSIGGRGNNSGGSIGSSVSSISQTDTIDGMLPMTPITPMTSISNSLQELEFGSDGAGRREYKRLRAQSKGDGSRDGDFAEDDAEFRKVAAGSQYGLLPPHGASLQREESPKYATASRQTSQPQSQPQQRLFLDTSSAAATIGSEPMVGTPNSSRSGSVASTPSVQPASLHPPSPYSGRQSPYAPGSAPVSGYPITPVSLNAVTPTSVAAYPGLDNASVASTNTAISSSVDNAYYTIDQEQHQNPTLDTESSSIHQTAAELFLSGELSPFDADGQPAGEAGVMAMDDISTLEENQRFLMLSRRLDDLGIYGYGVLHDFL
ncbi:hypothetical protein BZA70DRAFT_279748 [Myxozyma melibiosi]|uniref:Homeobox domain-containing protein n=1 Tax=Myxozyma melibiosi TaxID=54550 RepID=A0ABR1F4D8_9ASCO